MRRVLNARLRAVPEWAVWLAGAIPLALLVADVLGGRAGVDPVAAIEHRLGQTALYFLIASLAVTPLARHLRINLVPFRRALGLLCFAYACLHLAAWVVIDMGLRWPQLLRDVVKRPYLVFGMAAFLLLVPLAATSNAASIRRLGARVWKRLHRAAYAAAILAALHWLWAGKVWELRPALWLAAILVLLALRLPLPALRRFDVQAALRK